MVALNAPPTPPESLVSKWLSPQTLALALSMLTMVLTAYIALDRRIGGVEKQVESLTSQRAEDMQRWQQERVEDANRWQRVEGKLDKVIEREISRQDRLVEEYDK